MTFPNLYKFKIHAKIGEKLCYTIYDAEDQTTGERVFLKVLNDIHKRNESSVFNFLSGARILKTMEHPNIVRIHSYGSDVGHYFIATEVVELEPLRSLVQDEFSLSSEDLIEIFVRIGKTLRSTHLNGVGHGLLTLDNIYIHVDGSIKIDDFRFSWYIPELLKISNEESLNFAKYISPDFYHTQKVDGRADIYSLGIILVELITGKPPFSGSSISIIQDQHRHGKLPPLNLFEKNLPEELGDLIERSLALAGHKRFHNLKEYVTCLEKLKQKVPSYAFASGEADEAEITIVHEPLSAQKYFDEDEAEPPKPEPTSAVQAKKMAGALTSIFKSRNFLLSAAALFLILAFVFVGSGELSLSLFTDREPAEIAQDNSQQTDQSKVASAEILPAQTNTPATNGKPILEKPGPSAKKTVDLPKKPASKNTQSNSRPTARRSTASKEEPRKADKSGIEAREPKSLASNDKPATISKRRDVPKRRTKKTTPPATAPQRAARVELEITSDDKPLEAFVFIDDKFRGKSDKNGRLEVTDLQVGQTYSVKVSKEGFATETRRFTATANQTLEFDIAPKLDIFGTLILDASPGVDSILVDGKLYRGQTPLKLSLPWGEHKVRLVNTRLNKSFEQVVNLKVGQILRVRHDFDKAEMGKVAISLKNAAEFGFGYVYVDGKLWGGKPNTTPVEISLPVGSHTIEVRREGFSAVPRDIIVVVDTKDTKYVSFTLMKNP